MQQTRSQGRATSMRFKMADVVVVSATIFVFCVQTYKPVVRLCWHVHRPHKRVYSGRRLGIRSALDRRCERFTCATCTLLRPMVRVCTSSGPSILTPAAVIRDLVRCANGFVNEAVSQYEQYCE